MQKGRYLIQGFLILIVFCYVFYKSFWPVLPGLPFIFVYLRKTKLRLKKQQDEKILAQFKDSITVLSGMLRSGYSVENAMKKVIKEMEDMWGIDSEIVREYRVMVSKMSINKTVEEVWKEFGKRSELDEIESFAQIFSVVKRSGGELSEVIHLAVMQIQEKSMTEEQIRVQISSRKYEQKIMNAVPIFILLYVGFSSPDLLAPMYETLIGRVIMSICLVIYITAGILAEHIADIEV